jgi:Icc-related predicted phosphoesterase
MEDIPHRGFDCFNELLEKYRPKFHCFGHVHQEYGHFKRTMDHPSGTVLVNACGYNIYEI